MLMCDFSSWGCTPDLKLNPQISAFGGHITSASIDGDEAYTVMSGTSMAAPYLAGIYASILGSYPSVNSETRKEIMDEITARLESNATLLTDDEGYYRSPRLQGTGLANMVSAADSDIYLKNPILELGDDPERTGVYELSFDVVNECNETVYLSDASLYVMGDWVNDGYNTLLSEYLYDPEIDPPSMEIGIGETKTFTYTLTLAEDDKAYLDDQFENGTFVEGFLNLYFQNATHEIVSSDELHGTFLAYYGDWEQAPVLEQYDYLDVMEASYYLHTTPCLEAEPNPDGSTPTYGECGYSVYDILDMNVGFNECYGTCTNPLKASVGMDLSLFGDNLYDCVSPDPERNAISNPLGTAGDDYFVGGVTMYPAMLRNARHIIMTVTNHDTGEVYYVDDTEYARKNTLDEDLGQFMANTYFMWDGTDAEGNYLPNGTNIDITYTTSIDYNDMEPREAWKIPLVIDNEAPVVSDFSYKEDTNKLTFTVSDNRYLSCINVYDAVTHDTLYDAVFTDTEIGASHEITVSMDGLSFDNYKFIIDVNDYATNYSAEVYSLTRLNGGSWDCPFDDVDLDAWYAESVEYAISQRVFAGVDATHFDPNGQMTRSMAVQVLYKLSGEDTMNNEEWADFLAEMGYENTYTDLEAGAWYTRAVEWGTVTGVVSGDGNGHFMPNVPIDRQQLSVMMRKFCEYMGGPTAAAADLSAYSDVDQIAEWAYDAMVWMVGQKFLLGTGNNCISPKMGASRAQCCAVVERYLTGTNIFG